MDLQKAHDLCLELMNKHGLTKDKGWSFQWINSTNAAGKCRYKVMRKGFQKEYPEGGIIMLSKFITPVHSDEKVKDTILHEIAHGLTKGHNHDYVWQRKAREIGSNGIRCFDVCDDLKEAKEKISKIVGTCPKCNDKFYKTKLPKRDLWCRCSSHGFKQENKIMFVANTAVVAKTVSAPSVKIPTPKNTNNAPIDAYKKMLDKFVLEFLPLINNNKTLFDDITGQAMQAGSWRTVNREVRKACNLYMVRTNKLTNRAFQEMFFYEGPMNGRTTHGSKAPWIGGKPS